MKKLLITFILLFVFIVDVSAFSNYGNVMGKFLHEDGSNFYRARIIPNNKVNVETDDITLSVLGNDFFDNVDILLIKSSNNLLNFTNVANDALIYYVDFYEDSIKVNLNGSITISSTSNMAYSVISFYNSNGVKEQEINAVDDIFSLDISHNGYLVIERNVLKELSIESGKGNVYVNGIAVTGKYYTKDDSLSLVIAAFAGYQTGEIFFNNQSILRNGGFITLNLNKTNTLSINYIKEDNSSLRTFVLRGIVKRNNQFVKGATIVLHSKEKSVVTDTNGFYQFNDVEYGFHTLSVFVDGLLVGYKEFNITSDTISNIIYNDDDIAQIKFANNSVIFNMNIQIKDNYRLDLSDFDNYRLGDVNIDKLVNINDLINMRKYLVNLVSFNELAIKLADVNIDGKVNINDVIKMRKYLAGLEEL